MAHHLTHPDSKQTIEVEAGEVPMYRSQGWLLAAAAKKAAAKKAAAKKAAAPRKRAARKAAPSAQTPEQPADK